MNASRSVIWTADEVLQATGGEVSGRWAACGVSIDSRAIEPGDLFVAIVGPTNDGHVFVSNALSSGAVAAIVEKPATNSADILNHQQQLVFVENTASALEGLAKSARERTEAKIIAVTGSVGKTGTKEMLKHVLADQGRTAATSGNLNNHFGLPLSLSRMPGETEFGVFEMGMSSSGEITPLSKLARPHVALITAIEFAHSEFFASIEGIADAKAEIFSGLEPSGVAVLNADNALFARLAKAANTQGVSDVRSFGKAAGSDCQLLELEMKPESSLVLVDLRGKRIQFELSVPGRHWVQNALGVLCAVDAAGADPVKAALKLSQMPGLQGRGRWHRLSISGGDFYLIDESYNASPASMRAAIEVLGKSSPAEGGRKIAVLGDMLELGDQAKAMHAGAAIDLQNNGIDLVFTTGQLMASLSEALPSSMRGGHASAANQLFPLLRSVIRPSDVVMVKGSNGSRTSLIVDDLLKLEQDQADPTTSAYAVNGN